MLKTIEERIKYWNEVAKKSIVGKKIKQAKYIRDKEFGLVFAIVLDDGTTMFPMRDDEGNGPGSLSMQGGKHGITCLPTMY